MSIRDRFPKAAEKETPKSKERPELQGRSQAGPYLKKEGVKVAARPSVS